MSAATGPRDGLRKDADLVAYPLDANAKVYNDTLVFNRAGTGLVGPARLGNAADLFVGVAQGTFDNSTGPAAKGYARLKRNGTFAFVFGGGTPTYALNGQPAYATDDQTVQTSNVNAIKVGTFVFDPDLAAAGLVRVDVSKGVQ